MDLFKEQKEVFKKPAWGEFFYVIFNCYVLAQYILFYSILVNCFLDISEYF